MDLLYARYAKETKDPFEDVFSPLHTRWVGFVCFALPLYYCSEGFKARLQSLEPTSAETTISAAEKLLVRVN